MLLGTSIELLREILTSARPRAHKRELVPALYVLLEDDDEDEEEDMASDSSSD